MRNLKDERCLQGEVNVHTNLWLVPTLSIVQSVHTTKSTAHFTATRQYPPQLVSCNSICTMWYVIQWCTSVSTSHILSPGVVHHHHCTAACYRILQQRSVSTTTRLSCWRVVPTCKTAKLCHKMCLDQNYILYHLKWDIPNWLLCMKMGLSSWKVQNWWKNQMNSDDYWVKITGETPEVRQKFMTGSQML